MENRAASQEDDQDNKDGKEKCPGAAPDEDRIVIIGIIFPVHVTENLLTLFVNFIQVQHAYARRADGREKKPPRDQFFECISKERCIRRVNPWKGVLPHDFG